MLFLTEQDVRDLLPMPAAVELMAGAFARLRAGASLNQSRRRLILPGESVLHQMAGADGAYFGIKFYSTNRRHGAWFLFALYRAEDGRPLAMMEANALGQIRTGAASGYATRLLAPPDADTVGLIGSGFQAAHATRSDARRPAGPPGYGLEPHRSEPAAIRRGMPRVAWP